MSSIKVPKRLFLAFRHGWKDCVGFTDSKQIIKTFIKERGKDEYYYMEVEKYDIPRVAEYLETGQTYAERLEAYATGHGDVKNIITESEYEVFTSSCSDLITKIDMSFERLNDLLPYIKFTDTEIEKVSRFLHTIYSIDDDIYDYPSEIPINEETAIALAIKNKMF